MLPSFLLISIAKFAISLYVPLQAIANIFHEHWGEAIASELQLAKAMNIMDDGMVHS
jgi:hypothetical protein